MKKKAVILLSGGLDSTTCLYDAKAKGYEPYCLIFDYQQRHNKEIKCAIDIATTCGVEYILAPIQFPWKGSALTDSGIDIPHVESVEGIGNEIPITYVPGRNIIFLSFAISYAEVIGAECVFIGANALDYSGYPDCRPEFFHAFCEMAKKGLKPTENPIKIETPLLDMTKAEIVTRAQSLNVPFEKTWSCYEGKDSLCGTCESCMLRAKGFKEAKIVDPLANGYKNEQQKSTNK